jgi:hypothetical protein
MKTLSETYLSPDWATASTHYARGPIGDGEMDARPTEYTDRNVTIREAGTLSNLSVNSFANDSSTDVTYVTRIGNPASDGNCSLVVPAFASGFYEDVSNTDVLSDGNLLGMKVSRPAASPFQSTTAIPCSALYERTGGLSAKVLYSMYGALSLTTTTYLSMVGQAQNATRANVESRCLAPARIHHLKVGVTANTRTGTSDVFTLYVNGSSTSLTVTVSVGSTGTFEDVSNAVNVKLDDLIALQFAPTVTGGSITSAAMAWALLPTNYQTMSWQTLGGSLTTSSQHTLGGIFYFSSITNNDSTIAAVLDRLWVYLSTFASTTLTVTLYKNGASTALTISPTGTGWTGDVSTSVTTVADDELKTVRATTGSASTLNIIQYRWSSDPTGFVQNDLYDLPFYVHTGGHIQLNLSGAYTTPTVRNSLGTSTTVATSVTVKVTVVDRTGAPIENAQVAVEVAGVQIINGDTNASGIISTTYGGATPTAAIYKVRKSSTGSTRYRPVAGPATIAASTGMSVKVVLREDPNV